MASDLAGAVVGAVAEMPAVAASRGVWPPEPTCSSRAWCTETLGSCNKSYTSCESSPSSPVF